MSVQSTASKVQYILSSGTQTLSVPFYFLENSHLKVIKVGETQTVLVLNTDYTVTGAGVEAGGSVILTGTETEAADVITIKRSVPITQLVDYVYNDRFPAETHERALDKLTMICQLLQEQAERSLRFEDGEILDGTLPLADRLGKILSFNLVTGDIEYYDPQDIFDAADEAEAARDAAQAAQAGAEIARTGAEAAAAAAAAYQANIKVATFAALTALSDTTFTTGDVAFVRGELVDGDDLGGEFWLDKSDTTTVTGKDCVASSSGKRWKRVRDIAAFGDDDMVQGREYLTAFQAKLISRAASKILFDGDSTTAGDSTTTPYRIWEVVPALAGTLGFTNVTGVNAGHSGGGTSTWLSTWIALNLAENPDLMVIRWGLNDPNGVRGDLGNADYLVNNIRTGLATIRAAKTVAQMSILLMMPNSCTDDPAYRTKPWFRQLRRGIQKAARDYQCAFLDTYSLLRDSSFGQWINEDYSPGSGRYVHPLNIGNVIIGGAIADLIIPTGFKLTAQGAGIPNPNYDAGVASSFKIGSDLPGTYPFGLSIYPALTSGSGAVFPYQGYVITFKQAASYVFQIIIFADVTPVGENGGAGVWAIRHGQGTAGWSNWWYPMEKDPYTAVAATALTLENSWVDFGSGQGTAKFTMSSKGLVQLSGLVKNGTYTPYGTTTTIATLPAGSRPSTQRWFLVPNAPNSSGGSQTFATVIVEVNGQVRVYYATGNYYLSLDTIQFTLGV